MQDDGAAPRDIADTLAEMKARKVSSLYPNDLVLGADQVLTHKGALYSKPKSPSGPCKSACHILGPNTHSFVRGCRVSRWIA